jgi:hypothetical protein
MMAATRLDVDPTLAAASGYRPGQVDRGSSDVWDAVDADFVLEERLYDEIFRLRRRLWIERAVLLITVFGLGCIATAYF